MKNQSTKNRTILNIIKFILITFFFLFYFQTFSQDFRSETPFNRPIITNSDSIKSVQLYKTGFQQTLPILNLNKSNETIELHFDYLSPNFKNFMYKVVHCDANWNISDLNFYDYADGLPEDYFINMNSSNNVGLRYVHYDLKIPNQNFSFKISGNYKLIVYDEFSLDTILEVGFLVFNPKVQVESFPKRSSNVELRYAGQEIDFNIKTARYRLTNPYQDLKVFILQNFRSDNAIEIAPLFVKAEEIEFDYDIENVFLGGNEFRPLDLRNLSINQTIAKMDRSGWISSFSTPSLPKRNFLNYKTLFDLNGRYTINSQDDFYNANTNNQYVWVTFTLDQPYLYQNRKVYVFGELSNWQYLDDFALELNTETNQMEKKILLKQGYYNYQFMVMEPGNFAEPLGNSSWDIEGTHHETENEYQILIYHKAPGTYYDALVGFDYFKFPFRD